MEERLGVVDKRGSQLRAVTSAVCSDNGGQERNTPLSSLSVDSCPRGDPAPQRALRKWKPWALGLPFQAALKGQEDSAISRPLRGLRTSGTSGGRGTGEAPGNCSGALAGEGLGPPPECQRHDMGYTERCVRERKT